MIKRFMTLVLCLSLVGNVFAQTVDTSLDDKIDKENEQALAWANEQLSFQSFESCQDMDKILEEYIEKYAKHHPHRRDIFFAEDMAIVSMSEPTSAEKSSAVQSNVVGGRAVGGAADADAEFSTTNIQKTGVDEPEIIKSNGTHIFYFNQQEKKVSLFKTPLNADKKTFNFDQSSIVSEITIPDAMNDVQLFLQDGMLVIAGTRYAQWSKSNAFMDRSARTVVALYDISNPTNPTLDQFYDIDGYLYNNQMRITGGKLYVLSQLNINWYELAQDLEKKVELETSADTLPKVYAVDQNKKVSVQKTDCNQIAYVLPSEETMEELNLYPQFTMMSVIDLKNHEVDTSIAFANPAEIHMSTESLYMVQHHWVPGNSYRDCPPGMACIMPRFHGGQENSLVHKFSLDNSMTYVNSTFVPGSPLTQYSMDEDADGNFRMLTSVWRPESATNLYILDKDLSLVGKLENIEPGEQFKASRYIGSMLYLVTFEQTDPLFVIDMNDITDPKIIGELKMPGFSTYLHPMGGLENDTQYLIGVGYAADTSGRQKGLQLSLYEVAYNEKETISSRCGSLIADQKLYDSCKKEVDSSRIRVAQIDSMTLGEEGSWSEVTYNPRMFVLDSKNQVTIPLILNKVQKGRECVSYESDGREIPIFTTLSDEIPAIAERECYDIDKNITTFAGLKSFAFDKNRGITEVQSKDYQKLLMQANPSSYEYNRYNQGVQSWEMQQTMMRVGFIGDTFYSVNNDFIHFFDQDSEKYIMVDKFLSGDSSDCSKLTAQACEEVHYCEPIREQPPCDADACIEIIHYKGCQEKK